MRLVLHLARLVVESFRFGVSTRRFSIVLLILLGLLLLALSLTAQTVAPVALYPFA